MFNPLFSKRGKTIQAFLTIACSSGFLLFGYDQGVFSGVIVTPYFLDTFNNPDANLLGIVNAIYDIGGAAGAIFCFFFGNVFGRKRMLIIGCVVAIVGAILQGTAKTVAQLLVGRIVGGIGVGQLTSTIGLWQAETSQAHNRGALMSIELVLCATGLLLAQWINYGFGGDDGAGAYQFPILFQLVFLAFTILLVPMLPESPRWLCARGKLDKAALSLVRLGSEDDDVDSPHIQETLMAMEEVARLEELDGIEWLKSLFQSGPTQNGKRVLMACLINTFQQLSGVNSVTYYVPTLLITFIGTSRSDSLWIAGLTSIISLSFAVLPVFFIDRIGRIPTLTAGAVGQGVCFFVVAGLFANLPEEGTAAARSFGIAIVSFIYIFFAIFSATWLGPSWMYGPEILPLKGRATGMGAAVVCYWMFNFLIVMITPPALENIGWRYYVILGVFNVCFVPVLLLFFVETKGRSLEDLDMYFASRYHGGAELRAAEEAVHRAHELEPKGAQRVEEAD
ncbi:general substrate transporter [Lineolata rhizophorae]|uniref:General substrate transporter n=1 Tax=Lineolata rhizophorae TaxID=578093 RepID=A0A6A6P187_9PEZI|nr:general substrate transporter [Lineolata rhizophorae]